MRIEDCEVIHDTGKALLVRIGGEVEKWVPQACVDDDSEIWKKGDKGDLVINASFGEREGWEEWAS